MIDEDVVLGEGVEIYFPEMVNVYGCEIGAGTRVGPFVEIKRGCKVGKHCNIKTHSFLADGTIVGDYVFFGPGSCTLNDMFPSVTGYHLLRPVVIGDFASIGGKVTILPGVVIGEGALVGAGSVVRVDVPAWSISYGNPCKVKRRFESKQEFDFYMKKCVDVLKRGE
jgi:UDP-2-acetamido-3-amino-2,3-dideoxy-glucuronate N-acetyltransferase